MVLQKSKKTYNYKTTKKLITMATKISAIDVNVSADDDVRVYEAINQSGDVFYFSKFE